MSASPQPLHHNGSSRRRDSEQPEPQQECPPRIRQPRPQRAAALDGAKAVEDDDPTICDGADGMVSLRMAGVLDTLVTRTPIYSPILYSQCTPLQPVYIVTTTGNVYHV